jgi:CRISPR-associated endonuclease/helicase Cas3
VNCSPVSAVAGCVWAKFRPGDEGWLPLWRHLDDSAAVAGRLWDAWLPGAVRRQIGQCLPGGEPVGRSLVVWLAGVHDIGKATPAFAMQVQGLADRMRRRGLEMPYGDPGRRAVPHAIAGQLLLRAWLVEAHGWQSSRAEPYAVVVGGHHGVPPTHQELVAARDRARLLGWAAGQGLWRSVQREFLDRAARAHGILGRLGELADVPLPQPVQVLLTAIVIVADWIASNEALFPYDAAAEQTAARVGAAWSALALPAPWRAVAGAGSAEDLLAARFDLPEGAVWRPVQTLAVNLAGGLAEPGLLVIEAPMGEGKTEAALAAAEVLAARSGAGGCFVALPTRATSDAMFGRVLAWLQHVPDAEVDRGAHSVMLAHGKARLNGDFQTLVRRGRSSGVAVDASGGHPDLAAHQWLSGHKTSGLSSFVVGTIDQLLFAGLKTRHLALRHLGLAGKVVIIDEAHAYDVYMSRYLERVLEWLGAYRVPTIVLSATLPADRRKALVEAYDRQRVPGRRPPRRRSWRDRQPSTAVDPYAQLSTSLGYPVITGCGAPGETLVEVTQPAGRTTSVQVEPLADDVPALVTTLRDQLGEGGCALVIRNTVARVQDAAAALAEAFGREQVVVAHSRFLAPDRAGRDQWLRDVFGPPGRSSAPRPSCYIVVASQVAEQSLDVDFDLLVSDLAPVDLLLQRLGRLHRHPRGRPRRLQAARCFVTGVDWDATPPEPVAGSRRVYGRHLLLRSLAALYDQLDGSGPVVLPGAIAPLVQAAYGGGSLGPGAWQPVMAAARDEFNHQQAVKREGAQTFRLGGVGAVGEAIVGWLDAGVGDVDDSGAGRAQVRDTAAESVEVVVVLRRADGALITVPWLANGGGVDIPTELEPPPWLARTIASCTLGLPIQLCTPEAVEELQQTGSFSGWQRSPYLQDQLVLVLDQDCSARLAGWELRYDRWSGLMVTKHA